MKRKIVIELHTLIKVPICLCSTTELSDCTLMFQPEYHSATQHLAEEDEAIYAYMINSNMAFIQVRNDSDEPITLDHHVHLEYILECLEEDCYLMEPEAHGLAGKVLTKIHQGFWVQKALTATSLLAGITEAAFSGTVYAPPTGDSILNVRKSALAPVKPLLNLSLETVLPNRITVYDKSDILMRYAEVVNCYSDL